ncbi:MAG: type II secretion system protein [Chthoniobacteraceae bacterium]|nr:type II secretion system protein [Chthoniobacteraceae bacterium]
MAFASCHPRQQGITVTELLVIMVVIVILAGFLIPIGDGTISRRQKTNALLMTIAGALEQYKADHKSYPSAFDCDYAKNDLGGTGPGVQLYGYLGRDKGKSKIPAENINGPVLCDDYDTTNSRYGSPLVYLYYTCGTVHAHTDACPHNGLKRNPGFKHTFELWSLGPDRDYDPVNFHGKTGKNRDNITVTPWE